MITFHTNKLKLKIIQALLDGSVSDVKYCYIFLFILIKPTTVYEIGKFDVFIIIKYVIIKGDFAINDNDVYF